MKRRFALLRKRKRRRLSESRRKRHTTKTAKPSTTLREKRSIVLGDEVVFHGSSSPNKRIEVAPRPDSPTIFHGSSSPNKGIEFAPRPDSPTIVPSLLLLGASDIPGICMDDTSRGDRIESYQTPDARLQPFIPRELIEPVEPANLCTNIDSSHQRIEASSETRINQLRSRLAGLRSGSYVKHVNSVLRYSSTDSFRSSVVSVISFASSLRSNSLRSTRSSLKSIPKDSNEAGAKVTEPFDQKLSDAEQHIWDELVDESRLESLPEIKPRYEWNSLHNRPCCGLDEVLSRRDTTSSFWQPDGGVCSQCGFSKVHFLVRDRRPYLGSWKVILRDDLDVEDYFGNTTLHHLAANLRSTPDLIALIREGANIHAKNTSGETFMHVLRYEFWVYGDPFVSLLKMLESQAFDFDHRDYHGRSILQAFFQLNPRAKNVKEIIQIFGIMKPSWNSFDNQGNTLRTTCPHLNLAGESGWRAKLGFLSPSPKADLRLDFRDIVLPMIGAVDPLNEIKVSASYKTSALLRHVDKNGETLLSTYLKAWEFHDSKEISEPKVEVFLQNGSEIHARDREGNTALTTAVGRGLRSATKILLSKGANVHCRNLKGQGIIAQAQASMDLAREQGDDKLYASILSCISLLADAGAKADPTERDEWLSPKRRAEEAMGIVEE
jgi:ankyrin repeat protein